MIFPYFPAVFSFGNSGVSAKMEVHCLRLDLMYGNGIGVFS